MAVANDDRVSELLQAQAHVWNHIFNFINSASLKCAIQLGIPDVIHNHGQPMTFSQLVASLPINPEKSHCIYRLMRILSHSGFFVQQKDEQEVEYMLTPASRLLLKDNPLSMSSFLLAMLDPLMIKPWNSLSTWFKNDDPTPFLTANGRTIWDYAGHDLTFNKTFNEGMASDTQLIATVLTKECKGVFDGLNSLVDVAGGTGTLGKAIAGAFPHLMCTVFDLPHVVANLQGSKNLNFTSGNMFEEIPHANAILLKWILHDWSDEECLKILKRCREAIPSREKGGKVIIIDMVIENPKERDEKSIETQLFVDMELMVLYPGRERNEKEWARLFSDAGFSDYKITPVLGLRALIEAYP